jgi:hypothetical protein
MEKEYWLFTLLTGNNKQYINCWYEWFPSKQDLIKVCRNISNCEEYAIINVTKFTEEQYNKLMKGDDKK